MCVEFVSSLSGMMSDVATHSTYTQGMLSAAGRSTEGQRQESSQSVFNWAFWGASCEKRHLMNVAFQVLIQNCVLKQSLGDFLSDHWQHFSLILVLKCVIS